jgi:hypothetical protein
MSRPGIEPGSPACEASNLEKSRPDSLLIANDFLKRTFAISTQNLQILGREIQ